MLGARARGEGGAVVSAKKEFFFSIPSGNCHIILRSAVYIIESVDEDVVREWVFFSAACLFILFICKIIT